jgi:deoxyribodipyrimidine photo-lyase
MTGNPVSIFWFRRDLRFVDNHGLQEALISGLPVLPVFIFDTDIIHSLTDKKDARVSFIHQTLSKLNEELIKHHSSLFVLYGTPLNAFIQLSEEFNVTHVYTNHDYEPYAINRDKNIADFLQSKNIKFHTYKDHVVFEKNEVVKPDGNPYTIFTPYSKAWKSKYTSGKNQVFHSEKHIDRFIKTEPFHFPSLREIGFEKSDVQVTPIHIDEKLILQYDKTRNIPSINGTSKLSTHLRFGTVSIRKLARIAQQNSDAWLNELIWRDFFMMILFHFPQNVSRSFKSKYDRISWMNNEKEFESWCRGETGYPIVDAGMRELNQTHWMHNRVRMIVAGFLTKHLLIDWRWGEAYFAEKLLDYELSSNNGNWQWAAGCGCDAAPYFRIFNPAEQTKRFDPELLYIKKWLGDLSNYTLEPMVEHQFARKRALETFKKYLTEQNS